MLDFGLIVVDLVVVDVVTVYCHWRRAGFDGIPRTCPHHTLVYHREASLDHPPKEATLSSPPWRLVVGAQG